MPETDRLAQLEELERWREDFRNAVDERAGMEWDDFGGIAPDELHKMWQAELDLKEVVSTSVLLPVSLRWYLEYGAGPNGTTVSHRVREVLCADAVAFLSPNTDALERYWEAQEEIRKYKPTSSDNHDELTLEERLKIVENKAIDMLQNILAHSKDPAVTMQVQEMLATIHDTRQPVESAEDDIEGEYDIDDEEYEDEVNAGNNEVALQEQLAPMIREVIRQMKAAGEL